MNILEVKELKINLGTHDILHGISLTVPERSIIAVLGANGAGKTTLMRAISGIYKPSGGRIVFAGQDIGGLPSHQVVEHGILQTPEGRQIFSNMTVRENLLVGAGPYGLADVGQVLDLFPVIGQRYHQLAGSLSGGEQQMLCIGRALMHKPRILLMDEPSLGLAPKVVAEIFRLIETIRAQGLTVLLVEQNARAALRIADYAAVIDGGHITLEGPAAQIAADPRIVEAYLGGHTH
ncbi:branched-chain amino acid transport system ATP-binding protein [Pseudomonas sp. JUb42]|jgi:branched-chain amino acid transport system ATP-binding protein|uniref:ABC transporter ATP-binding protein n=1 Tax=Pseudomonas sp. JUb42 TaxID=2940611 RepID=UPI00216917C5|nr:ABC transporter ATP-binding protein [Pseudomonas sp. JUb42]MCS3472351.1 branched-chain amino acid transport system ATP-binding protein [Pseudomonas sp. JUb42]